MTHTIIRYIPIACVSNASQKFLILQYIPYHTMTAHNEHTKNVQQSQSNWSCQETYFGGALCQQSLICYTYYTEVTDAHFIPFNTLQDSNQLGNELEMKKKMSGCE